MLSMKRERKDDDPMRMLKSTNKDTKKEIEDDFDVLARQLAVEARARYTFIPQ